MVFKAVLESLGAGPMWIVAWLPFDPAETWPVRSGLRVKGTIRAAVEFAQPADPFPFHTSLQRSLDRGYFLLVTVKMRKGARLTPGGLAEILLEPDLEGRAATPPPELAKLLRRDRSVRKWFGTLNYSSRKYIADTISEPKSAEARKRRAELWMERMMLMLEGEQQPPPILQSAFRCQPLARTGWDAMTLNQRRMSLWGIYGCQSPEAQAKRVDKTIADALGKMDKVDKAKQAGKISRVDELKARPTTDQ